MYNKIMKKKVIENKIQKENRLLSAAFELLTENEIQKVSVNDIVNKANVAKGTFYLYFKDKYDIRNQIVQEISSELFNNAMKELKKHNEITHFADSLILYFSFVYSAIAVNGILLITFLYPLGTSMPLRLKNSIST